MQSGESECCATLITREGETVRAQRFAMLCPESDDFPNEPGREWAPCSAARGRPISSSLHSPTTESHLCDLSCRTLALQSYLGYRRMFIDYESALTTTPIPSRLHAKAVWRERNRMEPPEAAP